MTDPRAAFVQAAAASVAAKLPPLRRPKVSDPDMARWIADVSERLEVREGQRGNPLERAVTVRELQQTYGLRGVITAGGKPGTILVQTPQGDWVALSAEHFASMIQGTRLWQDLVRAIDDPARFDRYGPRIKAMLLPDLGELAAQRGAAVQQLQTIIQSGEESFAAQKTEITAAIGQLAAGVRESLFAEANNMVATAGKVTQIVARLDDFDGGTATVEEVMTAQASRIDGLSAEWYIKVSAGNAIAGIGVSADQDPGGATHSAFIVEADQMAFVGAPNFAQEATPTATAVGQLWYKPSTKAWYRSTATGTGSWVTFTPKIPLGIDTVNDTIYIAGTVLIDAGGHALSDLPLLSTSYWIVASVGAIARDTTATYVPATVTFSGYSAVGTTGPGAYAGRFKIYHSTDGSSFTLAYTSSADESSKTYTPPAGKVAIKCELYLAGGTTTKIDETIVPIVDAGSNAITVVLSNPAQTLPSDNSGTVSSYTNSGTTIQVYEGANLLTYTTGTIGNSKFKIGTPTVNPSGKITVGAISGNGTTTATVANHSAMDGATDSVQITYPLTIQKADGTQVTPSRVQVITKAKTGAAGAAGTNGTRGSFIGDGFQYGIRTNTWSDNLANRVIENMNTGSTSTSGIAGGSMTAPGRVLGDRVTLGNGNPWYTTLGAYGAGTAYVKNDIVIYSGSAYRCVQAGTGHQPDTSPTYWVSMGAVNATGAWASSHAYSQNDTATSGGVTYLCKWKHTSDATSLANDLATADVAMTKMWDGAAWLLPGVIIDGNLIVLGTLAAEMFDGVGLRIGPSQEFQIDGTTGQVTSSKFFGYNAQFGNTFDPSKPTVDCTSYSGTTTAPTFRSTTHASNSGAAAHAIRGQNNNTSSAGLIGGANGWDFYADGTGAHPGYGPFTGGHDALMPNGTTMSFGDIVVDVACIRRKDYSNTIFEVAYSTAANQAGAVGVLVTDGGSLADHAPAAFFDSRDADGEPVMSDDYEAVKDSYRIVAINALGEGQINVCGEGGEIAVGDLIVCSSTSGKGMKQADDIVRGYTVAKAREAVTFSDPSEVKTVACIYLCG